MPKVVRRVIELRHAKIADGRTQVRDLQAAVDKLEDGEEFCRDLGALSQLELGVVRRWVAHYNRASTTHLMYLDAAQRLVRFRNEQIHAELDGKMQNLFSDESILNGMTEWMLVWPDRPIANRIFCEKVLKERVAEWKKHNSELKIRMDSVLHDETIDFTVTFTLRDPEQLGSSSSSDDEESTEDSDDESSDESS